MKEDCLKETICLAKAFSVLDEMIEENSELTENLAKIIELKEHGKVHQIMHILATGSAMFCIGVAVRALINADPNEFYGAIIGTSLSSMFSLVGESLSSVSKNERGYKIEDVKDDLTLMLLGKYFIGMEVLTKEEQERVLNVLISEMLKDKQIVKKIKTLSKQKFKNYNDEAEL